MVFTGFEDIEEEQRSTKQTFKRYKLHIIVLASAAFYLFVFYRNQVINWPAAQTYFIVIVTIMYVMESQLVWWKHASAKVISNPYFSSFNGDIYTTGNYVMIRLGGAKVSPIIYMHGREATAIVPKVAMGSRGPSVDLAARLHPTALEQLPQNVQAVVKAFKYPEPYLFGLVDYEVLTAVPDLAFVETEMKQLNAEVTRLRKENALKWEDVIRFLEQMSRAGEIITKKGALDKLRDAFMERRPEA